MAMDPPKHYGFLFGARDTKDKSPDVKQKSSENNPVCF
jgi:hypothetical protein